jgi:hypothetical protein
MPAEELLPRAESETSDLAPHQETIISDESRDDEGNDADSDAGEMVEWPLATTPILLQTGGLPDDGDGDPDAVAAADEPPEAEEPPEQPLRSVVPDFMADEPDDLDWEDFAGARRQGALG